jgi:hypothetical protein
VKPGGEGHPNIKVSEEGKHAIEALITVQKQKPRRAAWVNPTRSHALRAAITQDVAAEAASTDVAATWLARASRKAFSLV